MEVGAILALLQSVPQIFALASSIRGTLSETDQAKLDEAVDSARAQALVHVAVAENDLKAAGES